MASASNKQKSITMIIPDFISGEKLEVFINGLEYYTTQLIMDCTTDQNIKDSLLKKLDESKEKYQLSMST